MLPQGVLLSLEGSALILYKEEKLNSSGWGCLHLCL